METNKIINLNAFLKENHITQETMASFLGTSRSFISGISTYRTKLPTNDIDKIVSECLNNRRWHLRPLNPFYYDLYILAKRLCARNRELPAFNLETGENPFSILPRIMLNIKYGFNYKIESIVDMIIEQFPNVNRNWLLTGNGEMILSPKKAKIKREQSQPKNRVITIELLFEKIEEINDRLKNIEKHFAK